MSNRRRTTASSVIILLLTAVPAGAHKPEPQRDLVVQVDDEGVAALWSMTVEGPMAELMWRVYDRDADGRLTDVEATGVALALVAKAARGVEIALDDVRLEAGAVDARLVRTGPSLVGVALVTLKQSDNPANRRRLTVRIANGTGPLRLRVQCLGRWRLAHEDEAVVARLAPGDRLERWIRRVGETPPVAAESR